MKTLDEHRKERKEIRSLLKSKENRSWYVQYWGGMIAKWLGVFFTIWGFVQGSLGVSVEPWVLMLIFSGVFLVLALFTFRSCWESINKYLHKVVETERPGCTVEIRVVDSYLTNAFINYPKSAMIIGINKAFWFQEAESRSLIADLWTAFEKRGIPKENVQKLIDEALQERYGNRKKDVIDTNREVVQVRKAATKERLAQLLSNDQDQSLSKQLNDILAEHLGKESELSVEDYRKQLIESPEQIPNTLAGELRRLIPPEEQCEIRTNYKIGTVIGIDLNCVDPPEYDLTPWYELFPKAFASSRAYRRYRLSQTFSYILTRKNSKLLKNEWKADYEKKFKCPDSFFRYLKTHRVKITPEKQYTKKLFLIANSEVVQGKDTSEQMKVTSDLKQPVAETFENIWKFFEEDEVLGQNPPRSWLYQPLLVPLIGAGVANEGYTDLEIFSQLVDLYYKHLRKSIKLKEAPAIPQMIINIQNKTAIKNDESDGKKDRKIDLVTAFWYLDYKNQVNLPENRQI